MPKLLPLAAGQTAQLFSVSNLSSPFELTHQTIKAYVGLLERVFLLERLPPWHSNLLRRLVKSPKLHLADTGLACALLRENADSLAKKRTLLGSLLETFVFQELRRQASWYEEPVDFFHYRDRDQAEVDIVVERGVGALAGIEVKASATVKSQDFRGLRKLQNALGERFVAGVVLYDGDTCTRFCDRLFAVPLRLLWEG